MPDTHIGERIREVRKRLGLNQQAFAARLNIAQSSLSQLESSMINPSLDTLKLIISEFNISYEYLLEGKTPEGETSQLQLTPATQNTSQQRPQPISDRRNSFPIVDQKAYAGYLAGFADPDYLAKQPVIFYPGIASGIAVHVTGNSMEPTIRPGDVLICTPMEDEEFRDNRVYVVVTREGALVKRVLDRSQTESKLILKSDNRDYSPEIVQMGDVLQVFLVRRRITADLSGPDVVFERINQLEQTVYDLRTGFDRLENRIFNLHPKP